MLALHTLRSWQHRGSNRRGSPPITSTVPYLALEMRGKADQCHLPRKPPKSRLYIRLHRERCPVCLAFEEYHQEHVILMNPYPGAIILQRQELAILFVSGFRGFTITKSFTSCAVLSEIPAQFKFESSKIYVRRPQMNKRGDTVFSGRPR